MVENGASQTSENLDKVKEINIEVIRSNDGRFGLTHLPLIP